MLCIIHTYLLHINVPHARVLVVVIHAVSIFDVLILSTIKLVPIYYAPILLLSIGRNFHGSYATFFGLNDASE